MGITPQMIHFPVRASSHSIVLNHALHRSYYFIILTMECKPPWHLSIDIYLFNSLNSIAFLMFS